MLHWFVVMVLLAVLTGGSARAQELPPITESEMVQALETAEAALRPMHPNVGTSLNDLARFYNDQGRYAEADPLLERALAIGEAALGPEHPDVGTSLNNLALVYEHQGRHAEAEPLLEQALAISGVTLGPAHPLTIQTAEILDRVRTGL